MSFLYTFSRTHHRAVLFAIIAGLLCYAWWNRFIQDDAFISFRYAENLARGHGLVWNNGERIEGYTNFLWTLVMSGVIALGSDPVIWSSIIGICCFACSLLFTYRIALLIFQSDDIGLATVILLGTNFTFSSYATGGLETSAQAALYLGITCTMLWWDAAGTCRPIDALKLSLLLTLSVLLRLDSAIICLVVFPVVSYQLWREASPRRSKLIRFSLLTIPFILIVGSWFLWKLSYYGDILPNTFYVKVASVQTLSRGVHFLHRYTASYLLYPFLLLGLFSLRKFFRPMRVPLLFVLGIVLFWTAYIVKVGGDFMEFRLLVPVIPFIFILLSWLIFCFVRSALIRIGLIVLVFLGTFHHASTFEYDRLDGIEPVRQLHGHIASPDEHWGEIGKVLGRAFNYDGAVSIATTAAGAIPYYSRLTTIDMLGLSDRYVTTHGYYFARTAGHERIATLAYLEERKVNLIISHPYMSPLADPIMKVPLVPGVSKNALPESKAVEIPIDSAYKLIVLYLTPNPIVDSVIARNQWKVHQMVMR